MSVPVPSMRAPRRSTGPCVPRSSYTVLLKPKPPCGLGPPTQKWGPPRGVEMVSRRLDTGVTGQAAPAGSLGRCKGLASSGDSSPGEGEAVPVVAFGWLPQPHRSASAAPADATAIESFITPATPENLPPFPFWVRFGGGGGI